MLARLALIVAIILSFAAPCYADDWQPDHDKKTITARTKGFEAELRNFGFVGEVISCSHLVKEVEGRVGYSWGANCAVKIKQKTSYLQMCDDDGIGYFALQAGTDAGTDGDNAKFMEKNCIGS